MLKQAASCPLSQGPKAEGHRGCFHGVCRPSNQRKASLINVSWTVLGFAICIWEETRMNMMSLTLVRIPLRP